MMVVSITPGAEPSETIESLPRGEYERLLADVRDVDGVGAQENLRAAACGALGCSVDEYLTQIYGDAVENPRTLCPQHVVDFLISRVATR